MIAAAFFAPPRWLWVAADKKISAGRGGVGQSVGSVRGLRRRERAAGPAHRPRVASRERAAGAGEAAQGTVSSLLQGPECQRVRHLAGPVGSVTGKSGDFRFRGIALALGALPLSPSGRARSASARATKGSASSPDLCAPRCMPFADKAVQRSSQSTAPCSVVDGLFRGRAYGKRRSCSTHAGRVRDEQA